MTDLRRQQTRSGPVGWTTEVEKLEAGPALKLRLLVEGTHATLHQVIEGWRRDSDCRAALATVLADSPFAAVFWEMPAITAATLDRVFECVLVESQALSALTPDPSAFYVPFARVDPGDEVVVFANLGRDAVLVAPRPLGSPESYTHLLAFSRLAAWEQQHAFWRVVGRTIGQRISDRPLWVSTSGLGVPWLHVRLDTWPKYYTFAPYRTVPPAP